MIFGKVCNVTFLILLFPGFVVVILMTIYGIGRRRVVQRLVLTVSRYLGGFMNCMELLEVESCGPKYTWRGTRNGHLVEVRLDIGLVNKQWFDSWPNTCSLIGAAVGSDHNPVIVHGDPVCGKRKHIFKFEAFWVKEAECKDIVERCWARRFEGGIWINGCGELIFIAPS